MSATLYPAFAFLLALAPAGPRADGGSAEAAETVRVRFRVLTPEETGLGTVAAGPVYLAGSLPALGSWRPDGLALRPAGPGAWTAEVDLPRGATLAYKATRGTWGTVEVTAAGQNISSRTLVAAGDTEVVIRVERWSVPRPPPPAVAVRGRFAYHEGFTGDPEGAGRRITGGEPLARTLIVYLPPGYDLPESRDRRYPVLYLHDGERVFAAARGARDVSWRADTTLERLLEEGRAEPVILVGVGSTRRRLHEYTPTRDEELQAGGGGPEYGRFLAEEVKPFIDRTYRTRPGRESTGVCGSSLGGLVSLAIARDHRAVFGVCAALSPALWWDGQRLTRDVDADAGWLRGTRFWVDIGTLEGRADGPVNPNVANARALARAFDDAGLVPGRDYYYLEVQGGRHDEADWARRFDKVLRFFFGK